MFTTGGSGGGEWGFLGLLKGLGGNESGYSNNIIQILVGPSKSYFAMKRGQDQNMQDWGEAGTSQNMAENDKGFFNWESNLIKDLLFPRMNQRR